VAAATAAEVVEGRGLAEGNTDSTTRPGHSAGQGVSNGLDRVREVAKRDKEARFTALLHHVDLERLWAAYVATNPKCGFRAIPYTRSDRIRTPIPTFSYTR
jgi:hypothetical protein